MAFVTSLSILAKSKSDSNNLIFIIVDQLSKIVYYELVKVTINAPSLVEKIINIVIYHYRVLKLFITDCGLLFISKFYFLLCYFSEIKKSPTSFYPQIYDWTKRHKSIIEAYFRSFVN